MREWAWRALGVVAPLVNLALRLTSRRAGVAIVYHAIEPSEGDPTRDVLPACSVDRFHREVRHLRRDYQLVPASALPHSVATRRRFQRFPLAVTFDDDLTSHLDHAVPVLRAEGIRATFFLGGWSLGRTTSPWWRLLQHAADSGVPASALRALVPNGNDAGGPKLEGKLQELASSVLSLSPEQKDQFEADLSEVIGLPGPSRPLNASEIQMLAAEHEVGFHTRDHHDLCQLDREQLWDALRSGRRELSDLVGRELELIAYPHGKADRRVADAARAAGYRFGFTTEAGAITPSCDPMLLGRLTTSASSSAKLSLQVALRLLGRGTTRRHALAGVT